MKKNLLFVIPSLSPGGGEKSLVNLLNHIDYNLYNVDLYLFKKTGIFINSVPKEVKILNSSDKFSAFSKGLFYSLFYLLKNKEFELIFHRLLFSINYRRIKNKNVAEQYTWKQLSKFIDVIEQEYDVAIGYLEKSSLYYTIDKVKAHMKVGWVHTNYTNSGMKSNLDESYFNKLNSIITVSEECASSLTKEFPESKNKIRLVYNIVSPSFINFLSKECIQDLNNFKNDYINIVTVSRLSYEKGIDLALKSCAILIRKGYKIKWFIVGEGPERKLLEKLIKKFDIEEYFYLLGIKENPYPYLKKADIYVQPSRYEGKSIAIDEAKILHKPIIVTNFETAKDQINDKVNGVIVPMDERGIAEGIISLIKNEVFMKQLTSNLKEETHGNEKEVNKFYEIIRG